MAAAEQQPVNDQTALLAGVTPRGESDALVRLITPGVGSLTVLARGLRKPTSKLAPQLQPADELSVSLAMGKGSLSILRGVSTLRAHPEWRRELDRLALYWLMAECAWLAAAEEEQNELTYQLTANMLRHPPAGDSLSGALSVFVLKLLRLHGLLPDLAHCLRVGHAFSSDEPLHMPVSCEGLIGRDSYNDYYARTGGGLLRLSAERVARWRSLVAGPLLDYPRMGCDEMDAAVALHMGARLLGDTAGQAVKSAEFLKQQWHLKDWRELMQEQLQG